MYAITANGFRTIASSDDLHPGETAVDTLPASVLESMAVEEGRARRTAMLRASDWTQFADNSLTAQVRAAFAIYRQALRDLPQRAGFPDVEWPTAPTLPTGAGNETGEAS